MSGFSSLLRFLEFVTPVAMKLAVSGKGGVGKSTVSAALALRLARRGHRVLAVDADPENPTLAAAPGAAEEPQRTIVPISTHRALIEERAGAGEPAQRLEAGDRIAFVRAVAGG